MKFKCIECCGCEIGKIKKHLVEIKYLAMQGKVNIFDEIDKIVRDRKDILIKKKSQEKHGS